MAKDNLRTWFKRKGEKGSKSGWVDCNAPDGDGGYKECAQGDRKKKPACRPTPSKCKDPGKGSKWGKKNEEFDMKLTNEDLQNIIDEELEAVLEEEGKKDACYHKVKSRYEVWPSAYASGALVKCRKVGAKNWGNKSKKNEEVRDTYDDEVVKRNKKTFDKALSEKDFEPHMMYNPETGKGIKAMTHGKHLELKNKGYTHEKPDVDEAKKKKPCKKAKGKKFVKRVNGRCRSYGQSGKAKDGGARIRPGTKKGDAYCARSAKIKKCKEPPCANDLSRKKWKCRGSKSIKEKNNETNNTTN